MKTKFTQLVILRKKNLDEVEMALQQNAQEINAKQMEIDTLVAEFAALKAPESGVYQAFLTFVHYKDTYRQSIDFKMRELALLKQKRKDLQALFKAQNIEYEKAKYLENQEIKTMLEKIKKQESKDLDEIAVMLYANQKELVKG